MSNQEPPISSVPVARPGEPIVSTRAISSGGYEGFRLPVAVLLDNVRSMYNVGAFFRAADGVGLQKLCLAGITAHPPKKAISKTALGAEMTVAWEHDWDAVHMAEGLRRDGFELLPSRPARMRWICLSGSPGSRSASPLAMRSRGCVRSCWRWRMRMCAFPC